ncbi:MULTISPECIES: Sec-independent protein translocase protein TatB [unclassified Pseudoxanthomonas]|uniref:Sec-independent protein translocase protein TatB n=1 Tax=unclassified Pseudoxanthomonas TaxID=2645906 RepID=UPI0030789EEE
MFDIGFSELLIVAIVALIVLGPERLPKATRFAGLWVRRARAQWHSVKDELERELAAEELKRGFQDAKDAISDTERRIRDSGTEVEREFDAIRQSVKDDPDGNRVEPDDGDDADKSGYAADALPAMEDEQESSHGAKHENQPEGESDEPRNV